MVFSVPVPDAETVPGPLEVVGSVVLPGLAVLALILVPFIDRGQHGEGHAAHASPSAWCVLAAHRLGRTDGRRGGTTPPTAGTAEIDYSAPTDWMQLSAEEMAGHRLLPPGELRSVAMPSADGSSKIGPDLTQTSIHKDAAWMIQHFKRPVGHASGNFHAADPTQRRAVEFPGGVSAETQLRANASALGNAPDFATAGALVYQAKQCGACHQVNGVGAEDRPSLEWPRASGAAEAGWKSISPTRISSLRDRSCLHTRSRRKTWPILRRICSPLPETGGSQ